MGLSLFLLSCSSNLEQGKADLSKLLIKNNLKSQILWAEKIPILVVIDDKKTDHGLIFIEGDGLSWVDKFTKSTNPTPKDPVSLKIMLNDHRKYTKIYLARPFQYIDFEGDFSYFWTSGRYAQQIINSYHKIINNIKLDYNLKSFDLLGYSGAGTILAILACTRDDVKSFTTFAGNIDHIEWSKYHDISVMKASINPMIYKDKLGLIKQTHYVGQYDDNITADLLKQYCEKINYDLKDAVVIVTKFNHYSDWGNFWNKITSNKN